jgi:hypothetical protein
VTQDQAIKQAGDTLIEAFPDTYGSITFNLQGKRKSVHCNVMSKLVTETKDGQQIEVDMKESKKL